MHLSKRFPGVLALDDVSLEVASGETLAVIGENGAGKSTLMKILAGIQAPDTGEMFLECHAIEFSTPASAIAAGVSLIHQELNLHENLTVAENLFLGREPNRYGWIDRKQMDQQAEQVLRRVGLSISPRTSVATLSTAACQLVEVAKALSTDASVIIMDEPTSSLSTRETEQLFELVHSLREDNVSIIYISHRLGEVIELADRVEVLRDGRNAGTLLRDQITHDAMVSMMVGRDVNRLFDRSPVEPGNVVMNVEGLRTLFNPDATINFQVRSGEVIGIAGLVGSGRSELVETLFGVRDACGGSVAVNGTNLPMGSPQAAINAGLSLVPEDRKRTGLLIESTVEENATLVGMMDAPSAPWLNRQWQASETEKIVMDLGVKTASGQTVIANLSGGNQQKIALGKWLLEQPVVLMLDEPTRGVDVGAKEEIYALLSRLAQQGMAVLFVSSEMEEVLAIADRVMVMNDGGISGWLEHDELTEEAIMKLAVGMAKED